MNKTRFASILFAAALALFISCGAAFAGLPADFRSAGVQRAAELAASSGSSYEIRNVRWGFDSPEKFGATKPRWRDAAVDSARVKDIYFCVKPFPPEWLVAHAFVVFEFEENFPLRTSAGETSKSLILSIEPIYYEGKTYGKPMTSGPMYIVYQLGSYEDYMQICNIEKTKVVFPFRLSLTAEMKKKVLEAAIEKAVNCDYPKYNLFTNNCINNIFEILNVILPEKKQYIKTFFKGLWNPNVSTPQLCIKALRGKNLLGERAAPIRFNGDYSYEPKKLTGAALEAAAARIASVKRLAEEVKTAVVEGLGSGALDPGKLAGLFFNEESDSLLYFYVPPVVPGDSRYREFRVGEEFLVNLRSQDAAKYFGGIVESYSKAVEERLLLEGPDVSEHLKRSLREAKKSVDQFVKYRELTERMD